MKTKQQKQIVNFSETSVLVINTTLGWGEAYMMRQRKPVRSARFAFMECLLWAMNPAEALVFLISFNDFILVSG